MMGIRSSRVCKEGLAGMLLCLVMMAIGANPPPSLAYSRYKLTEAGCVEVDELCLVPEEVPNYEAIRSLHYQLDDDRSGDIDLAESVDFLKEELQYQKGYEKRQRSFHYNNDQYISVAELWYIWKQSEVHNWTVDQTVGWLAESVELQQYAHTFYQNAVNGSILPRLAANNEQFLTKVLGIKDPKHRSKITIKAMDVVLFGPPKETGSHMKDLVLVSLLTLALIGCFKAYQRNREYQGQLSDMLRDMEKLREAEENLQQLEQKMTTKVRDDEGHEPRRDDGGESHAQQEVQQLKLQLEEERVKNEQMKEQMKRSVDDQESSDGYTAPQELQLWLQLTYERERVAFEKKQTSAREQFSQAREMCEKLNKQRRSLMGMLASVHGKMDNVDQAISMARTTMEEVTQELRERDQRWHHIEDLSGCPITTNPGLHALELMLRPHINSRPHFYGSSIGASSFHHSLGSTTGLARTPRESTMDLKVMGTSSSIRKKNHQLLPRDSGSSLGSEAGITHSHTFASDVNQLGEAGREEGIRRVWSVGSLQHHHQQDTGKDSNDSSTDETDFSVGPSDTTSFTMGGSRLTLNSDSGVVTQVSAGNSTPSPIPTSSSHPGFRGSTGEGQGVHRPNSANRNNNNSRRGMIKSYSHDVDAAQISQTKLEGSAGNLNHRVKAGRGKKPGRVRPPGVMRRHSSNELGREGVRSQQGVRRHSVAVTCFLPHHPNATIMEESPLSASPHIRRNGFLENHSDEREKISCSESALNSPLISGSSVQHRRKMMSPAEEGNSSDSSMIDEHLGQNTRPQRLSGADSKKRQSRGGKFPNGLLGSLKLGKSKKGKEVELIHKESTEKI